MATFTQADGVLDASTLMPLPPVLKHGLIAVSFLGFVSFISSSSLFVYLTYKLIKWRLRGQARKGYNQFLILIYNLLIADIQQSLAFLLTARWLVEDKIDVKAATCWAEGWFVSTGDLASGVWIFAIALHTFFAIIKGRKLPYPAFLSIIFGLWLFIYAMAITGVATHTQNFYVRAGAWCWIGEQHAFERLWLHYFWIFIAMFGTIILYGIMYFTLHSRLRPQSIASSNSLTPLTSRVSGLDPRTARRAARYMLVYPIIYVVCTLPLASARMAAMSGHFVSYWYYCTAGAAITSCGWLDVLLYACTRRVLVFSDAPPPPDELGVETFGLFNSSRESWSVRTVVEGGVLEDPTVSTRRRAAQHRKNISKDSSGLWDIRSQAANMDDTFGIAMPNTITTKTTIQVTNEPRTPVVSESTSRLSMPMSRSDSKADTVSQEPSPVDTIFINDRRVEEEGNMI